MRILVRRTGAMGDVLETTAITSRLRKENPDAFIAIETDYCKMFEGNQDVDLAGSITDKNWDRIINLNMTFEDRLRKVHPIDAYSEVAFGDRETSWTLKLAFHPMRIEEEGRYVIVHAARSWPIRTLPLPFWQSLLDELVKRDYKIILTGTAQDHDGLIGDNIFDVRGKLDIHQQAALIESAHCFICSESGPMILAQVTRVPIIALLTMVPPEHVLHERFGKVGWRFYPIQANVSCVGCASEQAESVTYFDCKLGTRACLTAFDVQEIANKVDEVQIERS